MNDNEAIETTVFHYYDGYRDKSRERLEKAFSLGIANMMGYIKNDEGKLGFFFDVYERCHRSMDGSLNMNHLNVQKE